MTGARCRMLAALVSPDAFRCPSSLHRFHFHGLAAGPVAAPLTGWALCAHRHASQDAAERCTGNPAAPVRLSDVVRARARRVARP